MTTIFSSCPLCQKGAVKKQKIIRGLHEQENISCPFCFAGWVPDNDGYTLITGKRKLIGHTFSAEGWKHIKKHEHQLKEKHYDLDAVGYTLVGLAILAVLVSLGQTGFYIAVILVFGVVAWAFPQVLAMLHEERR